VVLRSHYAAKEKAADKAVSGFGGTDQRTLGILRLTAFIFASWLAVFAQQSSILSERRPDSQQSPPVQITAMK
jgi:hypothetical protein